MRNAHAWPPCISDTFSAPGRLINLVSGVACITLLCVKAIASYEFSDRLGRVKER